jgi:DNA-directed RNA polymerase subunit RPC12/RpoP
MPRVTCRCGQKLSVPVNGPERVICPKCQSRIRVRRDAPETAEGAHDGFIRFACDCGRRLKVRATPDDPTPQAGRCPDCGRLVPVPTTGSGLRTNDPEARTEELDAADIAALDRWSGTWSGQRPPKPPGEGANTRVSAHPERSEAGLRVCPRCGRPVHLSAVTCRDCGSPVPKR